ncbi:MAG: ABC transporter ATP-binding protein [Blastochloris sp.]|nr:ABC transporter ATP-binding protein [Blastochloris sp.]
MSYCLEKVSKGFVSGRRELTVLREVSLELGGEVPTVIQGASGSGKTTLLNLLGGLDAPSAGRVLWRGEDLGGMSRVAAARWRNKQVGFVFQSYQLMPQLNALENVLLPGWLGRRNAEERARELLGQVGLGERLDHLPRELSGGEQQRVAIARALIQDPAVLLADEPTGNLDAENSEAILHLLLDLTAQTKKVFILVTHDDSIANRFTQRYLLRDGELKVAGT